MKPTFNHPHEAWADAEQRKRALAAARPASGEKIFCGGQPVTIVSVDDFNLKVSFVPGHVPIGSASFDEFTWAAEAT
ncbi:hypothetical protein ORI20_22270 [Mycobacterium sp. CVI_P3]|uniref:hypothetical protein n=1 Tax=Mycobacterium pinniadriaticum TaxID=2994102 RepID=UPI002248CFEA|nr:hypothetical protein [Mycobacterium pinniadriaticum]MCX2933001.1 hypothetical protein [Mycobacterium pinniadriaticum]